MKDKEEDKEEKGWKGYIFSRPINGQLIPQRVQNLVIRHYIQRHQKVFLLSATEYSMDKSYMMLKALMREKKDYGALVFYSLHQLPGELSLRAELYREMEEVDCHLHFALEELKIANYQDRQLIEDIFMVKRLSQFSRLGPNEEGCPF